MKNTCSTYLCMEDWFMDATAFAVISKFRILLFILHIFTYINVLFALNPSLGAMGVQCLPQGHFEKALLT